MTCATTIVLIIVSSEPIAKQDRCKFSAKSQSEMDAERIRKFRLADCEDARDEARSGNWREIAGLLFSLSEPDGFFDLDGRMNAPAGLGEADEAVAVDDDEARGLVGAEEKPQAAAVEDGEC